MLGQLEQDTKRKIYLSISKGKIVHYLPNGGIEYFKNVEGTLQDIYTKERSFNGKTEPFWYIDLRDGKEVYSISLGKCVVLGICSILNNSFCIEELRKNNKLNYLINSLFELVIKQKKSETAENKNLMKKELNCNFVEEDENSDSDFIDYIELEDEKELIDEKINDNENIKNSDIYQYFTNTMKNLENYDKNLVDNFVHSLSEQNKNALENLIHTRQVKINYKEEEIFIPRRTVKIKRTNNP